MQLYSWPADEVLVHCGTPSRPGGISPPASFSIADGCSGMVSPRCSRSACFSRAAVEVITASARRALRWGMRPGRAPPPGPGCAGNGCSLCGFCAAALRALTADLQQAVSAKGDACSQHTSRRERSSLSVLGVCKETGWGFS